MRLESVKRVVRPLKRGLSRAFEFKSGIMLSRPASADRTPSRVLSDTAEATLRQVSEFRPELPVSAMHFHLRQTSGNEFYELLVGGQPVCFGWVANGGSRIGVLHHLSLTVPASSFYIWDCFTPVPFRGNGYFQQWLGQLLAQQPAGARALVAVDTSNAASRAALARAGFSPEFTYLSVRVFGCRCLSVALKNGRIRAAQPSFDDFSQRMLAT